MCARRAEKWKNTHLGPPRGTQAARSMHPRDLPALAPAHNRENVRHQKRAATVDPRAVLKLEGRTSRLDRLSSVSSSSERRRNPVTSPRQVTSCNRSAVPANLNTMKEIHERTRKHRFFFLRLKCLETVS